MENGTVLWMHSRSEIKHRGNRMVLTGSPSLAFHSNSPQNAVRLDLAYWLSAAAPFTPTIAIRVNQRPFRTGPRTRHIPLGQTDDELEAH